MNGIGTFTRAVLASSEVMFSLSPTVTLYRLDTQQHLKPVWPVLFGQIPMIFYEISSPAGAEGSWWTPACSVPDTPSDQDLWGEWVPLKAAPRSVIVTRAMLRPRSAWCWVPIGVIEQALTPIELQGRILGSFPSAAPS